MDVKGIQRHLETIQQQNISQVTWLQELLETYSETVGALRDATTDAKIERASNRTLAQENEELKSKFEKLQYSVEKNSVVLVLIDADTDGYVFNDEYLLQGTDGGRKAAFALQTKLRKELPAIGEALMMIKLYANIDKLANAMFQNGMREASRLLRDFCRGFCQTGGLSEFIDVGDGDDRADHQIKGMLQRFQGNLFCKQIVLGSCHDNGYVCQLDIIKSEGSMSDRITLLKSFHTGRQYNDLPFKSISIPQLFRTQAFSAGVPLHAASPTSGSASRAAQVSVTQVQSYAALVSASVAAPTSSPNGSTGRDVVLVNKKGERLDITLKHPPQQAFDLYHRKKKELQSKGKSGPCNSHYLGGGCSLLPAKCQFWHDGFSDTDVKVLRYFMRFQPCDKGLQCKSAKCFYGHACVTCTPTCKFSSQMHSVARTGPHEVPAQ